MKNILYRLAALLFVLALNACTAIPSDPEGRDYFPGGSPFYDYGVSQSKENFANVERAQSYYALYSKERSWTNIKPGVGVSTLMLQAYYPLHVRWQLKDGRQFIAENIDVRGIMREYFKSHDIQLPWRREGRPRAKSGDANPALVREIKDDTVILKWRISTNHTPVDKRFIPSGAATLWHITDEEFFVAAIKGTPTSGINFDKWFEMNKGAQ